MIRTGDQVVLTIDQHFSGPPKTILKAGTRGVVLAANDSMIAVRVEFEGDSSPVRIVERKVLKLAETVSA